MSLITLTTDFGLRDAYVPSMKGVLIGLCPEARLVDISHEIAPQDVMEAAFVLQHVLPYYPEETVHLVVVDPGVGTSRRPVALRWRGQYLVGPDNGLFSLVLDGQPPDALVVLDRPDFWRTPSPSPTFHGRDVFAPAAAHLALGRPLEALGSPAEALERLLWALPIADSDGVRGWVVHVDRFGNCITNVPAELLERHRAGRPVKIYVGSAILDALHRTYAEVESGEPLALFSSGRFLEIAVNGGSAAELLDIRKSAPINVVFLEG